MRAVLLVALQALLLLIADTALAADRRVALVIGNGAYAHASRLPNPTSDAAAVAAALRRIGFAHVREARDLTADSLRRELAAFSAEAAKAEVALVFFAGHGIEVDGQNYLIPTDARLADAALVEIEAIPLATVTSVIAGASKLRLVILDACRNNPFRARMEVATGARKRSIGRGLARVEPGENELIAFAAAGGTEADDGDGRHSPFTAALLKSIETPGLEVRLLFGAVRDDVLEATRRRQTPHVYGTLGRAPVFLSAAAAPAGAPLPKADDGAADLISAIEGMSDRDRLAAFTKHRNPAVARAAAARLAALVPAPLPAPVATVPAPMATTPPGSVAVKLKRGGAFATVYAKPGDRLRDEGCGDAACPELFLLPKGTYKRGSEESDIEKPVREVTIGYHVAVGSTEVTRGEFAAFVKATGHRADGGCYALDSKGAWGLQKDKSWRSPGFAQTDDHPVVCVSWDDTQAYINWLSSATGQTYRLLTEAEWEHAARGVTSAGAPHPRFHFGDDEGRLGDFAWYSANSGNRTQPVGGKKRNAFGLFDMHGNVWEWVQDCWAENYDNAPTDGSALENDQCSIRALRGGSWHFPPPFLRAAFRFRLGPDYRDGIFGFRLLGVLGSARTF